MHRGLTNRLDFGNQMLTNEVEKRQVDKSTPVWLIRPKKQRQIRDRWPIWLMRLDPNSIRWSGLFVHFWINKCGGGLLFTTNTTGLIQLSGRSFVVVEMFLKRAKCKRRRPTFFSSDAFMILATGMSSWPDCPGYAEVLVAIPDCGWKMGFRPRCSVFMAIWNSVD